MELSKNKAVELAYSHNENLDLTKNWIKFLNFKDKSKNDNNEMVK